MVNLQIVNAATANITNATLAFGLTHGPFGLQELESVLSFPPRNGRSWIVSVQTSDIVTVIFTILVLTFAIDKYLFNSRYLVHIGGVKREKDDAAILNEKASLYEKEALNVESALKSRDDKDSALEPSSQHDSSSPASTAGQGRLSRAIQLLTIFFLACLSASLLDSKETRGTPSGTHKETSESSIVQSETEEEVNTFRPTSWWGRFVQHPVSQKLLGYATMFLLLLSMLAFFAFHLLFWPLFLGLSIGLQGLFCEISNSGATVPWQSIALKSTSYLAIWTIVGVNLLLKPNRLQGMLWKCVKWTHAVNWWLFWFVVEGHACWGVVARRIGFAQSQIVMELVFFVIQPLLVVYLYSGVVRDAVVAVRLCKSFWNSDLAKS